MCTDLSYLSNQYIHCLDVHIKHGDGENLAGQLLKWLTISLQWKIALYDFKHAVYVTLP